MPIIEITQQPPMDSLNAAYRPIVFRIKANIPGATSKKYIPPVVYCDVYVEDEYYKSFSRSMYINNDGTAPEFEFDIQDAAQEVLEYNLPVMNGDKVERHYNTIKKVFVKFRNAYLDNNGFTISEQKEPVIAKPPIDGGGTESNTFFVLNSVIQHEEIQDLECLLNSYKTDIWDLNTHPLTKRPKYIYLGKTDSSYFPIITEIFPTYMCIEAKYIDGSTHVDCAVIDRGSDLVVNAGDDQIFAFDYIKYCHPWLRRVRVTNPIDGIYNVKFIDYYYPEEGKNAVVNVFTSLNDLSAPIANPNITFNSTDLGIPFEIYCKIFCTVNGNTLQSNSIGFGTLPDIGKSIEYTSNYNNIIEVHEKIPILGNISGKYNSFHWVIIEKPEGSLAIIENKNSLDTNLIPDLFGRYILRLEAYNDKQILSYDDVIIQINKS